jgi:hypothetical protein
MFKRIILEARKTLAEMTRIMGPPKPMVGAGNRPMGPKPTLKPAITPSQQKPHGMGGTGMEKAHPKLGGAGMPNKPAHQVAGKPKPMSSGAVNKVMGGQPPVRKPPAAGASSGSTAKGSGMKMNGMGKGRENS